MNDGAFLGFTLQGTGSAIVVGPAVIRVEMLGVEPFAGAGVTMTAAAGNGIVAAGDGAAWGGATDVGLPFP